MAKISRDKINFKHNLSVYFSILKKYKVLFVIILLIALTIEATYVIDKALYKYIVDRGTEFAAKTISQGVFVKLLVMIAVAFLSLVVFRSIVNWIKLHLINRLDSKLILDLKRKYFNHILELSHRFHTNTKTGSIISRLGRGARAIERLTDIILFNFAPLLFQLVIVTASLIYFDWVSAIVVFSTIMVFLGYSLFIQKLQEKPNLRFNKAEDIEKGNVGDIFTNIDSIKYFGKEKTIKQRFAKLTDNTRNLAVKHWDYFRWFDSGHALILGVGVFLLVYFPIKAFLAGQITMGTVVFVYTVFTGMVGSLFGFVWGMRDFYKVMADFEYLFRYGKIKNEIKEKKNAEELKIKKAEIQFKNMGFKYGRRNLFENFNLKIPKNKKYALVGHSGCGKTTLIKLLYRFYDVNEGKILVDGKDIRNLKKESLRSEMSIVPQEPVLFDDTIYNNVAFSNPKATKQEVMRAIKFAQLDKIIENFPRKEKTIVGERGVKLSGGEKQRVSIARAILANKKVLVLDEATSSLDSETESEIQKDLEKLMEGRTSIIIAHRLSTIMKADKIIVMKKGKIVQKGSHRQLINKPGEYRKLWNLQKGGYIK